MTTEEIRKQTRVWAAMRNLGNLADVMLLDLDLIPERVAEMARGSEFMRAQFEALRDLLTEALNDGTE